VQNASDERGRFWIWEDHFNGVSREPVAKCVAKDIYLWRAFQLRETHWLSTRKVECFAVDTQRIQRERSSEYFWTDRLLPTKQRELLAIL
jgi:hypothetical protein